FILRRQKSQVAKDLPEKFESVKYSQMTPEQEEKYEEVKSYYRNQILDTIEKSGIKKSQLLLLQGLTKLRQIANHPKMIDPDFEGDSGKLEDITYMIESAISEGHKILIFSQFVKHLSLVKAYLEDKKTDFAYLDGSTKDRQGQVEKFQNNEKIKVFLISLKAGGLGLNLTEADYVFLLDPWWNPAIEEQAVDRAHRIGQKNTVFTYKFITRNTVEEKILALQKNKLKLASELITTEESFIKKLTTQDISELLS
ncbi:MAG TPA: DEAD/DEAH box helicase, partial [Roseivirga sp.]